MVIFYKILLCTLLLLVINGCAKKPWTDPLKEEASISAKSLIDSATARDKLCQKTVESDLALFYSNPIGKKAVEGYFLFSPPDSYKFIVTNPFGQTSWAVAGNQKKYQILNPVKYQYTAGSLDSFGIRNNIPPFFFQGEWYAWLTAHSKYTSEETTTVRADNSNRGIWFSMQPDVINGNIAHVLLDPENLLVLENVVTTESEKELVTFIYSEFEKIGDCYQPQSITITGLDYGTEIRLRLKNIALLDEVKKYKLPVPPHYFKQYLP